MNQSINILFKNITRLPIRSNCCFYLQFKKYSSSSIKKTFLIKSNQNLLKNKLNSTIFLRGFKFGGNSAPLKKEKITYNGIRRLLALAAPEKYKLMGMY